MEDKPMTATEVRERERLYWERHDLSKMLEPFLDDLLKRLQKLLDK